ncbi:hypothetical protein LG634_24810 [Streptomyces bambusae]|uniref:hypothetical protein n=1 Tax=Streptomyces bambusae TaxID=1550616 RepID=UPI001CFC9BAA|nr:hypothetical protein [Streptomyces bambusae]MCB5168035.1 hypothetical protein [Streptomyces bambusae]
MNATVREIRHEVRIDLTDTPPLTSLTGSRRRPCGIRLTYAIRADIARVDIAVEWEDTAEAWPPTAEMPAWLDALIEEHRPRDVDEPDAYRPAGLGGRAIQPRPTT